MSRLTPAELDALEAALADIVEGMQEAIRSYDTLGPDWTVHGDAECFDVARIVNRREYVEVAHNALPALIAAARATVPEPIREKHRDGSLWRVWEPVQKKWHDAWWEDGRGWMTSMITRTLTDPTHALPMPAPPIDNKQQTKDNKTE